MVTASIQPTAVHFRPGNKDVPYVVRIYSVTDDPDVWPRYLSPPQATPSRWHGVRWRSGDRVPEIKGVTTWCALAELGEQVIGGVAVHRSDKPGRLSSLERVLADAGARDAIKAAIGSRAAHGVAHCSGLWALKGGFGYPALNGDLGRAHLVAAAMSKSRFLVAAATRRTAAAWKALGYAPRAQDPTFEEVETGEEVTLMWCDLRELEVPLSVWVKAHSMNRSARGRGRRSTLTSFRGLTEPGR